MAVKQKLPIYLRTQLVGGDYGTGDVYWDNVSLLALFGEERKDWSTVNHTLEFKGNAAFDTTISRFPGSRFGPNNSVVFDGTGDYVRVPDHISLSPESQSFTIEFHVRFAVDPGTAIAALVTKWDNPANWPPPDGVNQEFFLALNNNQLQFTVTANGFTNIDFIRVDWNPAAETWYHVACVVDRELATHETRFYVDGVQVGASDTAANSTSTIFQGSSDVWVGGYGGGSNNWVNGNIENVRITKGVARYTEAFTPPRAPHPNYKKRGPATSIYNYPAPVTPTIASDPFFDSVVFLAPYTTNFDDVSGYNIPGVAIGSPLPTITSTETLFGENVLDLTGANDNDAITYFDTSGFNLGAEDFTFEFHANFTDKSVRQLLGGGQWGGLGQRSWFTAYDGTTNYLYYYNSTNGSTILGQYGDFTFDPTEGQWYHFAWVRDGNSFRCFVDGVELTPNASNPMGTLYNPTNDFYIGDLEDPSGAVRAYMANVRLTRGIKRYTANFTPPTLHHPTRGSTYREAVLADEPLVYFRMDDFDSGINGNPIGLAKDSAGFDIGSLSGSPAGARWAENTGDTVRFRNASILPCGEGRSVYHTGGSWGGLFGQEHPAYTPSGSLTIEGWVCVKGTITNQCPILTKEAVGTNLPEYKLTINSSRTVTFYLGSQNSSTNSSTTTTTTVLDLDTVYHVVGVFRTSDNVPRIFINGVEDKVGSPVWPYTVYDNTSGPNSLVINDGGNSYRGEVYMQEVAFYPTGLTDAQILNHYTLGSTAPTNDPYWYWTELLLPFDGTDGVASPPALIDQSDNAFTGNFVGSAELDTAQKKFGTASAFFGGSPRGYISFPDNDAFSPESKSLTVECHVRFNGDPGISDQHTFVNKWNNGFPGGAHKEWWVGFRSNLLQAYISTTGTNGIFAVNVSWDPAGDTWYHIAFVFDREKSLHETRVYVDGVQVGASNTGINSWPTIFNGSSELWVGGYDDDVNDWMNGWIDNVRITNGVARYVTDFTPPAAPFPTEQQTY